MSASKKKFVPALRCKGITDDIVSHMIGKLSKNKLGQAALGVVFDAVGEGTEELISDVADPFLKTIYNGMSVSDSFKENWDWKEAGYDFLVGAVMGAIGGSIEQVGETTGLKAPDERSEFFMQAGEQGLSFEQAQSEWSNRNASADASGTGAAAETEGDKSDTEKYLRRLEEIGYLPAEQAKTKNAAHDGAAVLLPFSSHEISNLLSSGKNCVLGRGITLKGFIQNAIKSKGQAGRLYLGKLPPKTIDAVRVNTGLDVSGFCSIANASEIWHAFKNHSNETRESNRGNIAITVEDIELFPEILVAPDSITLLPTQDGSGRNAIVFTKRFGNDYVTVQGYSNKKKALVFDTMWIKKGTSTTRSTVDQSKDQEQTSETKRGYGAHE